MGFGLRLSGEILISGFRVSEENATYLFRVSGAILAYGFRFYTDSGTL